MGAERHAGETPPRRGVADAPDSLRSCKAIVPQVLLYLGLSLVGDFIGFRGDEDSGAMMNFISIGCRSLDEILGGGIPFGRVTLIYGEASTGKTTLAMRVLVNYLRAGGEDANLKRALYVDSDRKFSLARFSQIAGTDVDEVLKRLLLCMPEDFEEQMRLIEEVESFTAGNIRLIVLDTITSLYREEIASSRDVFSLNRGLNRQLAYLREAAEKRDLAVLLLSQVHSTLKPGEPSIEPVSSRLLRYWSDIILRLDLTPQPGVRVAVLEKPRRGMMSCRFRLVPSGLVDLGLLSEDP
ncbi:DNA repair protein RadB [Candidatus Bathyarchaeota archaeon]|nr:MAG: DNA repair protein RadB [Candidatus Bathyarchaeota archaeon]